MIDDLKTLEKTARQLEPDLAERNHLLACVIDYSNPTSAKPEAKSEITWNRTRRPVMSTAGPPMTFEDSDPM